MPLTEDEIVRNINERLQSRESTSIYKGLDQDKQKGADSLGLAKDTGQDPQQVLTNYDSIYRKSKGEAANEIVKQDPWLRQYIRENPLGSTISQDDWGALSEYTRKIREFDEQYTPTWLKYSPPSIVARAVSGTVDDVRHGIKALVDVFTPPHQRTGEETPPEDKLPSHYSPALQAQLDEYAKTHGAQNVPYDLAFAVMGILGAPISASLREGLYKPFSELTGIREDLVEGYGNLALMFAPMAKGVGKGKGPLAQMKKAQEDVPNRQLQQVLDKAQRTFENAESWTRIGERPPRGVDPTIDQLIGLESLNRMTALDAVMEARKKSETMELSPEAWQQLNKIAFQNSERSIFLNWEAARLLYGDKLPEPGDKILGHVTGIDESWKRSQQFGEPIEIPLHELPTLDPEVYKAIQEDLFFEGGMTSKVAKEVGKQDPEISTIHEDQMPGLSQDLRRQFVLEHQGEGLHDIINDLGEKVGQLRIIEQDGGKNLFIAWEKGQYDSAGLISLMNKLKERYPQAETISTVRIPGMESLQRALQGSDIAVDMPFRIKERPVDLVRKAGALRPLFDLPEHGPTEIRMVRGEAPDMYHGYGKDAWTITDQAGNPIASLEITPKKGGTEAYIGWIGSSKISELGTKPPEALRDLLNKLGPTLMRSIVRQIQENYPEVTHIGGTRITGASEKAMIEAHEKAQREGGGWTRVATVWSGRRVSIPIRRLLDEAEEWGPGWHPDEPMGPATEDLFRLISEGYTQHADAWIKKAEPATIQQMQFFWSIEDFLNKVVGKGRVNVVPTEQILKGAGTSRERGTAGMFTFAEDIKPFIHWSFESPDPYATAGHEAIHFLRTYGIITEAEWATLKKAAEERGWLDTPEMERYAHYRNTEKMELFYEEAIADEFKRWAKMDQEQRALPPWAKFFQKILDLYDHIKSAYREFMGKEATADQIMRDIQIGRYGKREMKPISPERFDLVSQAEELPEKPRPLEENVPTFAPGAIMDKKQYARYQRHMNNQNADDVRIERENAIRDIKRRDAPEWKANREKERADVVQQLGARPDFRARAFFQNGLFFGESTHFMPKVDPKFLTKEQKAEFPARWQERKGIDPDMLATQFGYQTGSDMINAMIQFEKAKGSLTPREFFERTVNKETDRRMEQKYGDLTKNVLEEATEQALGHTQLELLTEEALALASRAGMQISLSKDDVKAMAHSAFIDMPQTKANYKYYLQEMYRTGKAAEDRFLVGDYISAFNEKWMQVHLFEMARQVKELERQRGQLERAAKRWWKRYPDNFPPEFSEWIQWILQQTGHPLERLPEDLDRMLKTREHGGDFQKFIDSINEIPPGFEEYEAMLPKYIEIADFLLDPNFKKDLKDMNVGELKSVNAAIQALRKIGSDLNKIHAHGEEADLQTKLAIAKTQLAAIGEEKKPRPPGKKAKLHQLYHIGTLRPEDLFLRLDKGNEDGFFTKFLTDPLNESAYVFDQLWKSFRQKRIDIDKQYGKTTETPVYNNIFHHPAYLEKDPKTGKMVGTSPKSLLQLTHQHVRTILLNWGNPSNRERILEGYHVTEAQVEGWLKKVATKEDYQWAQAVGKLFDELQKHSDEVSMRESSTMIQLLPLPDINTPHGPMAGWYYPVIYDRAMDGGPKNTMKFSPRYKRTYRGFERERVGPAGPIDMSMNMLDMGINRRIHDIAFREVLRDFRKIKDDRGLRSALERYMGRHYVDMLDRLHDDIAMPYKPNSGALQAANRYSEFFRANTIMLLVGLKAGTFMKHVPSTFVQSWSRAGIFKSDFYTSSMELMPGHPNFMENWNFIANGGKTKKVGSVDFEGSREIAKRWKHYAQIHGVDSLALRNLKIREKIMDWSSKPLAAGDMLSSAILYNAVYKKLMREYQAQGMTLEQAHVKADTRADMAIRQTHGSTSIVSRPELLRRTDTMARWMTSLFTYYNHVYGQTYKMMWRTKDAISERRRGDIPTQSIPKYAAEMTSLFMTYHVLPAFFYWVAQDMLLGKEDDEDESLAMKIAMPLLHNAGGMLLGVRDVMGFLSGGGQQPTPGIIGQPLAQMWNFAREFDPHKEWTEKDPAKVIRYGNNLIGLGFGYSNDQAGMWMQFLHNYLQAVEEPEGPGDWYRAFRRGTIERRRK